MSLDQLARDFRAEGYSFHEIAWTLGVDRDTVRCWFAQPLPSSGFLQPGDVAALLAISPKKVRALIRSGAIRASNLNDARRPRFIIRSADLDEFVKSRRLDAAPANRRRPAAVGSFKRYRA